MHNDHELSFIPKLKDYKTSIGKIPSVWKVFFRVFRAEIFWAGVNRLMYDLMCLVGPLALSGVVAYAITYGDEVSLPSLQKQCLETWCEVVFRPFVFRNNMANF